MKIAYVEDDQDACHIFASQLKTDGHHCDTFGTAESFCENVKSDMYDALIVDIRLPGLSGIDMISKLRKQNIFTPCILITAFNSLEYAHDALNADANYLLEKPFRYAALMKILQKITTSSLSVRHCVDRGLLLLNLTARENEIAQLMLKGLTNGDIARVLKLSEKTVKQYVTQIFQKARVGSRSEFFASIFPV